MEANVHGISRYPGLEANAEWLGKSFPLVASPSPLLSSRRPQAPQSSQMARDHYVPQALIKGFADERGHLHYFDKKNWKLIYPTVPKRVLFEWDYETANLAKLLKCVETVGMEGISLLRGRKYDAITNEILSGLIIYLIAHMTRSPHHFEEHGAKTPEDREVVFQTETVYKLLNSGNTSFHPLEFRPSAVPLYVTDNPVCVVPVAEGKAWITFPIASRLMMSGIFPSPEVEGNRHAWHSSPQTAPDELAERINTTLFKRATRIVLCETKITPPVGSS
jgi:hypothetical protein